MQQPQPAGRSVWIVSSTHPHQEDAACRHLERQGFDFYCPMLRKRIRHARRTEEVLRPMFPGYIFIRINLDAQPWRPILSTVGIRSVVRTGERPTILDDEIVIALKSREVDGAVHKPSRPLAVGQKVRLTAPSLDGRLAQIESMNDKQRVIVLIELLNRPVRLDVAVEQLGEA